MPISGKCCHQHFKGGCREEKQNIGGPPPEDDSDEALLFALPLCKCGTKLRRFTRSSSFVSLQHLVQKSSQQAHFPVQDFARETEHFLSKNKTAPTFASRANGEAVLRYDRIF